MQSISRFKGVPSLTKSIDGLSRTLEPSVLEHASLPKTLLYYYFINRIPIALHLRAWLYSISSLAPKFLRRLPLGVKATATQSITTITERCSQDS